MVDNKFTYEKYEAYLNEKYAHLNDNGAKAKEHFDLVVNKLSK